MGSSKRPGDVATAASPPLIDTLISEQNSDGGWGYGGASSWTEPTGFAMLALAARGDRSNVFERGTRWLETLRRSDGGWPPNRTVTESTWVTGLAVMAMAEAGRLESMDPSIGWLLDQTGQESGLVHRLRHWMLGMRSDYGRDYNGWPWFPGAAAWVMPTALTVVALRKVQRKLPRPDLTARIREGQNFLLSRACRDGGWNHGSSRALGYESPSYAETTGVALLALQGVDSRRLSKAIGCAELHLRNCRSAQAACWLRLGLVAHGKALPMPVTAPERAAGKRPDSVELSLRVIAEAAENGRNVFLD